MNDRPDLALATGCDGVHVGQEDAPYAEARRSSAPTASSASPAMTAATSPSRPPRPGADYVAFGAFFPSTTKAGGKYRADPEILRWWSEIDDRAVLSPSAASRPENCGPLVAAGADFLAVISAVWDHPEGPGAAVKSFLAAIATAS